MRLRWSLAITWLMLIVARVDTARRTNEDLDLAERNRRSIDSLFSGAAAAEETRRFRESGLFEERNTATGLRDTDSRHIVPESSKESVRNKSFLKMPSELDIFQDPDSQLDSEYDKPHVRVKRISNSPSQSNSAPLKGKSSPSYIAQRRVSRKIFKRFSPEETNPADESEAEYAGVFDDGDVDVPGAYLNDELSKKRNNLEDVYPEVTTLPRKKDSPQQISSPSTVLRKKRDREGREQRQEEAKEEDAEAEADCAEDAQGQDIYYDEEEEEVEEANRPETSKRASQDVEAARDSAATRTSAARASPENSKSNRNVQSPGTNHKAKEQDYRSRFPGKEQRLKALNEYKLSSKSSPKSVRGTKKRKEKQKQKKKPRESQSFDKIKSASINEKVKLEKKLTLDKVRAKLPPDKIAKVSASAKVDKRASAESSVRKPANNSESVENSRLNGKTAAREEKKVEEVGNGEVEYEECAEEEEADEAVDVNDKERSKRKSFVIKTIPRGSSVKEVQIYQQATNPKTNAAIKMKTANKAKVSAGKAQVAQVDKTAQSIGEMRDLLGKLIAKVDNLHNLVSEMRSTRDDRLQLSDEKLTRSNFHVDSGQQAAAPASSSRCRVVRRRWSPWTLWTDCNASCGVGSQSRSRRCLAGCSEVSRETEERVCRLADCPPKFLGIF